MDGGADGAGDDVDARRAVEHLLQVARIQLGMEAAFLAELTEREQIYRATAGDEAESFTIVAGGRLPRLEGYCRHVMETDAPWVIRDTTAEPEVAGLEVTAAGRFGAYIGVPVKDPDGQPFGTLCCVSHRPRLDLGDHDVATMRALADVLGFHVAQLTVQREELDSTRRRVDALVGTVHEQELQLELFQHLVDASPNPKLLLDPGSLRIAYANRAAADLAGAGRDDLRGSWPWERHACWARDSLERWVAPLRTGADDVVAYELEPVGGAPAMDVQVRRVAGDDGPTYLLWTGHDVARHREVEGRLQRALELEREAGDQLRRLDALRNAFLTAVSHELRTPLTTVRGVAELVQRRQVPPERVPELLDRLRVNAERLDRLLADLLDLNEHANGSLGLRRETVRLDELIRGALTDVDLGDHDLVLRLDEVEAEVAPVKIERVVVNLAHNAAVHTPPGTPVEVELSAGEGGATIVVRDHGPGVPPADRATVFEPFAQGPTAPSHRPGTGIGLALVAAFTELHGGRVWIDDAPGGGAVVHVHLPDQPTGSGDLTPAGA